MRREDTQSYLISAALIVAFVVAALALARGSASDLPRAGRAKSDRPANISDSSSGGGTGSQPRGAPKLSITQLRTIRASARRRYAARLEQRFRRRRFAASAAATGPRAATLEFRWKKEAFDPLHMQRLEKAVPQRKEVPKMGFERLIMRVGDRVVSETKLD